MTEWKQERNDKIRELWASRAMTTTEMVAHFSMSRQRINQIVHPERTKARASVARAIRGKRLVRAKRCEHCGRRCKRSQIEAHHSDYAKPLEVQWLCWTCHKAADRENGTTYARRFPAPTPVIVCERCGATKTVQTATVARRQRYCSRRCAGLAARSGEEYGLVRHTDGHWLAIDYETGRQQRAERILAERHLGRRLGRTEWVVLIDGNPDNLSLNNIAVVTPAECARVARCGVSRDTLRAKALTATGVIAAS
jgi:hypothetical protein